MSKIDLFNWTELSSEAQFDWLICINDSWFCFRKGKEKEEKTDTDAKDEETDAKETKADDKKKKRKIRLDMHLDQVFLDSQVINE